MRMRMFRTIGLLVLGALVSTGIYLTRDNARAQENRQSGRVTVTPVEWSSGQPFRYISDRAD